MALAEGKSSFKTGPVTLHTETAIHIAEKLTNVRTRNIYSERHGICTIAGSTITIYSRGFREMKLHEVEEHKLNLAMFRATIKYDFDHFFAGEI